MHTFKCYLDTHVLCNLDPSEKTKVEHAVLLNIFLFQS